MKKIIQYLVLIGIVISCYNCKTHHLPEVKPANNDYKIIETVLKDSVNYLVKIEVENKTALAYDSIITELGKITDYKVGLAFYRYGPWNAWTKPMRIDSISQLKPNENQFFLWKTERNQYGAIVPLSGNGFRSTIGQKNGHLIIESAMGVKKEFDLAPSAIMGFGDDPFQLIESIYAHAMREMGRAENLRIEKKFPEIFEYMGYCTWNAMYTNMNEEKIIEAVHTFTKNNFPIGNLIIDDGWLDLEPNKKLNSFQPIKSKFPNGFKPMIERLKSEHNIKNVGVWHTLNGYWKGLNSQSALFEQYPLFEYVDDTLLSDTADPELLHIADPRTEKGAEFFNDWYKYMSQQGVSFVKVDNQLITERISKNKVPIFDLAENLHNSMHKAANTYFNGTVINCMDMTNDAFYNFGNSAVARTVEDYFPYKKNETYNMEKGNTAAHVTAAIYNSLWFGQMVYPDFDMFQSHHPNAEYHAIARALSSGPIYITDIPGQQNFDLLNKLITSDGRILRSDAPLVPTEDCLFQVQGSGLLKAYTYSENAALLSIFHATDAGKQEAQWSITDIPRFQSSTLDQFVVYNAKTGATRKIDKQETQNISLERMESSLYWIVPIKNGYAPLGLLDKYNGPAALSDIVITNTSCNFEVRDGGQIGVYAASKPKEVKANGEVVDYLYQNNLLSLNLALKNAYKIEIEF